MLNEPITFFLRIAKISSHHFSEEVELNLELEYASTEG